MALGGQLAERLAVELSRHVQGLLDVWGGVADPHPGPPGGVRPPGLSSVHICTKSVVGCSTAVGDFVLQTAVGGQLTTIRQVQGPGRPREVSSRGQIRGYSFASRRRMMSCLLSINRGKVGAMWFLTLTLPHPVRAATVQEIEEAWAEVEQIRRRWVMRLERRWAGCRFFAVWKKEPHEKSAGWPHLHVMLFWLDPAPGVVEFRGWNDRAWAESVGCSEPTDFENNLRYGCKVEEMRSMNGVSAYAAKYMSKVVRELEAKTGRIWGVTHRQLAPIEMQETVVPAKVGKQVRRVLRRLQERRRASVWSRCRSGRPWWQIASHRCGRGQLLVPCRGSEPIWGARAVEECRGNGWQVKVVRASVCHRRAYRIWQEVEEGGRKRMRPAEIAGPGQRVVEAENGEAMVVEFRSDAPSMHFVDAELVKRLLALFMPGEDEPPF